MDIHERIARIKAHAARIGIDTERRVTKATGLSAEAEALLNAPGKYSRGVKEAVLKKFGVDKLRRLMQTEDAGVLKAGKSGSAGHSHSPIETGIVYKVQIADHTAALPGGSSAAIEASTPIIEDQNERLAWYAGQLGVSPQLHTQFQQLLGVDKTEAVYRLALINATNPYTPTKSRKVRKALDSQELIQLDEQRLQAMGIPQSVILALGNVLKGESAMSDFVKNLMADSSFWHSQLQPTKSIKAVSNKSVKRDPFWGATIKGE